jgi:putative hemolysin
MGNGVFAMTEIAVLSARKVRLKRLAEQGDRRAQAALDLAAEPNRFLPTVQFGITLIGVMAGAFGGATLAEEIAKLMRQFTVLAPYARGIGFGCVVVLITYCSLVIGELVPKRIALINPERIAWLMAGPMNRLAALARPAVYLLGLSTNLILRLLHVREQAGDKVSEDEVKGLLEEGRRAGVFHQDEPLMVERVMGLDRLHVRDLMTPRAKIIWININDSHERVWHKIVVSGHTTFPVYEGSRDNVVGVITVKAIYANLAAGVAVNIRDLMTQPLFAPTSQGALTLLNQFRRSGKHIAITTDEFGGVAGLITLHNIMEAVLGDFPSQSDRLKPTARQRDDGSWLVDAMIEVQEFERLVTNFKLDAPAVRDYRTLGGYVLKHLGRVPAEGDYFEEQGFRVEIVDMDNQRVDKVLLMPLKR